MKLTEKWSSLVTEKRMRGSIMCIYYFLVQSSAGHGSNTYPPVCYAGIHFITTELIFNALRHVRLNTLLSIGHCTVYSLYTLHAMQCPHKRHTLHHIFNMDEMTWPAPYIHCEWLVSVLIPLSLFIMLTKPNQCPMH